MDASLLMKVNDNLLFRIKGHRPMQNFYDFAICILIHSIEPNNPHDKFPIKIIKNETNVGYVSQEISRYCFMYSGGKMRPYVCR